MVDKMITWDRTIYKKVELSCAHHIAIPGYSGKCLRPHGHNYICEVWVQRQQLNKFQMVIDFSHVKEILNQYDHQDLNELMKRADTTAECLSEVWAKEILQNVTKEDPSLVYTQVKLRVWETENSYAEILVANGLSDEERKNK